MHDFSLLARFSAIFSIADSKNNRTAIKQQEPYTSCFYGRGEDYRGQVKVSVSGKQCLQWSFIGSYEARHSYCRNYNGLREGPWCYTSQERKEYCDIPKCVLTCKHLFNQTLVCEANQFGSKGCLARVVYVSYTCRN